MSNAYAAAAALVGVRVMRPAAVFFSSARATDEARQAMAERIGVAEVTPTDTLLPMAATCAFQLKLPPYSSQRALADRLRYAVYNCKSMELC